MNISKSIKEKTADAFDLITEHWIVFSVWGVTILLLGLLLSNGQSQILSSLLTGSATLSLTVTIHFLNKKSAKTEKKNKEKNAFYTLSKISEVLLDLYVTIPRITEHVLDSRIVLKTGAARVPFPSLSLGTLGEALRQHSLLGIEDSVYRDFLLSISPKLDRLHDSHRRWDRSLESVYVNLKEPVLGLLGRDDDYSSPSHFDASKLESSSWYKDLAYSVNEAIIVREETYTVVRDILHFLQGIPEQSNISEKYQKSATAFRKFLDQHQESDSKGIILYHWNLLQIDLYKNLIGSWKETQENESTARILKFLKEGKQDTPMKPSAEDSMTVPADAKALG